MTEQPYKLALTFSIASWAKTWRMEFNKKWKILHTGRNNPMCSYTMNGIPLTEVDEENYLSLFTNPWNRADIAQKWHGKQILCLAKYPGLFITETGRFLSNFISNMWDPSSSSVPPRGYPVQLQIKKSWKKNTEKGGQNGFWLNWSDFNEERLIELNLPTPQMHR